MTDLRAVAERAPRLTIDYKRAWEELPRATAGDGRLSEVLNGQKWWLPQTLSAHPDVWHRMGYPYSFFGQRHNRHVYFTLTSGGRRAEGEPVPETYSTADEAWGAYDETLKKELSETAGRTVVWRTLPYWTVFDDGRCCVSSRLWIGDLEPDESLECAE